MKKQIKIKILPDGKIEANTLGIKGKGCTDYIDILEKLLEAKTESSKYTEEYCQSEIVIDKEFVKEQGVGRYKER